jgi:hypothetical protein
MTGLRTTGGKRQNLESGEVGLFEYIDLKLLSPREAFDEIRCVIYKLLVLRAQLLVHNSGKTWTKTDWSLAIIPIAAYLPTRRDHHMDPRMSR